MILCTVLISFQVSSLVLAYVCYRTATTTTNLSMLGWLCQSARPAAHAGALMIAVRMETLLTSWYGTSRGMAEQPVGRRRACMADVGRASQIYYWARGECPKQVLTSAPYCAILFMYEQQSVLSWQERLGGKCRSITQPAHRQGVAGILLFWTD